MENKKPDVNSLEDLLKVYDEFRKWAIDFGNELSKVLADIKAPEKEEDTWEMKCTYKYDRYGLFILTVTLILPLGLVVQRMRTCSKTATYSQPKKKPY